jgi:hypothetical protein
MIASFALALAMPLVPASSFPEIVIRKGETEHEWPFAIDAGELTCIRYGGQKYVFFSEILTPDEMGEFGDMKLPRMVVVTANPMAYFATVENSDLYLAWDSLETLIRRLAPYERMGWDLCDTADAAPQTDDL